jgi:hypothetical protein
VDHAAVATRRLLTDAVVTLDHEHTVAARGERGCTREPDRTCADDHDIHFVHAASVSTESARVYPWV